MKKVFAILSLASLFFASSSYFSEAASFNPVYNGIFSTAAAGASPAITFDISQDAGQDSVQDIIFNFPAGFDIKGGDQLPQGQLIGSGQFTAVIFGSNMVFPLTIRSYSQAGAKAMWEFNFNSQLIVDAILNGSVATGHTLTYNSSPPVPIATPLDLNFQIFSGVFTNLVNGGPFKFSADMTSSTGLKATSFWAGAIEPPPPGAPPPPPSPVVVPPSAKPTPPPSTPTPVAPSKVAPVVSLDKLSSPTNQAKTLVKGAVSFSNPVSLVQVSLDGGVNWFTASTSAVSGSSLKFEFLTPALEDNNYTVVARAVDNQNLTGTSAVQTLIVDTAPPTVGTNELLLGGTNIFPDQNGVIEGATGVGQKIVVSAKGGPTSLAVQSGDKSFPLQKIDETDLWQGEIKFDTAGNYPLTIKGVDGAGNVTNRAFNPISVVKSGEVIDNESGQKVNARVTLYTQDSSGNWLLWDGESYSQTNPVESNGTYSYFVPAGKYYLKVEAGDFREFVSSDFSFDKASQVNFQIPLEKRPTLNIFGVNLVIPTWLDFGAQVVPVKLTAPTQEKINAPTLPTLSDFSALDQSGNTHKFSDYKGNDSVFTFWSTWNLSSPDQLAQLAQVKGVDLVPIASQNSQGEVLSFLNRGGFSLDNCLIDKDGAIGAVFGVTTAPQHFFVNKQGKVRAVRIGILSAKEIMEIVKNLD